MTARLAIVQFVLLEMETLMLAAFGSQISVISETTSALTSGESPRRSRVAKVKPDPLAPNLLDTSSGGCLRSDLLCKTQRRSRE